MVADTVVTAVPVQTAVRTVGDAVSTSIAVNSTEDYFLDSSTSLCLACDI